MEPDVDKPEWLDVVKLWSPDEDWYKILAECGLKENGPEDDCDLIIIDKQKWFLAKIKYGF